MATAAQIAASKLNAQASTGPRTESGKHRSSRNAVTVGLFTLRDFVLPAERGDYARLAENLRAELNPCGMLEETYVAAIVGAAWRLRRCSAIEERMAETCLLDPMEDAASAPLQASVDRARTHSHNLMRRSLAELRRLQTERTIREEIFDDAPATPSPDLTSYKDVTNALNNSDRGKLLARKLDGVDSIAALLRVPPPASFCTPRNAPAVLQRAA